MFHTGYYLISRSGTIGTEDTDRGRLPFRDRFSRCCSVQTMEIFKSGSGLHNRRLVKNRRPFDRRRQYFVAPGARVISRRDLIAENDPLTLIPAI